MKKVLLTTLLLLLVLFIKAQDTISYELMKPLTHYFTIEDGKMAGEGADYLLAELEKTQHTMLGEYHGSYRISEFTGALIPELSKFGYKNMVVEVGPETGKYLNALTGDIKPQIAEYYDTYKMSHPKNPAYPFPPFPFFDAAIDIDFLAKLKQEKWNIIGVDQEFYLGYLPLLDNMYNALPKKEKKIFKAEYSEVVDSVKQFYADEFEEKRDFAITATESKTVNDFLNNMEQFDDNKEAVDAFRKGLHIYYLYSKGQYFDNNSVRAKYMKRMMREGLAKHNFDWSKDKILLKMGGNHTSKGYSPMNIFDVGNMLNELAEFNGNQAINIGFTSRFYEGENGEVDDNLHSEKKYHKKLKSFVQMGKKDEWTLIDLRPLLVGHFYGPVKYKFENDVLESWIKRSDFIIIPPTDKEALSIYVNQ